MTEVVALEAAGYRYIKGVVQYSSGVAALPGFAIERACFRQLVPMTDGFRAIEEHLRRLHRPVEALCACELRSPEPFTEDGFLAFNREYIGHLERRNILRDGTNPIARTNVCPEIGAPTVPSVYAFSYTVKVHGVRHHTFVIAGSGEAPEGKGNYRDHMIRPGDFSPEGLREKARWVLNEMEKRMAALEVGWAEATATQLYTIHDVHPFLGDEIVRRGAARAGLTWHFARPPVRGLDYEMDVRGVLRDYVAD